MKLASALRGAVAAALLCSAPARADRLVVRPYLQLPSSSGVTVMWETERDAHEYLELTSDGQPGATGRFVKGPRRSAPLYGLPPGRHHYRIFDGDSNAAPLLAEGSFSTGASADFDFLVYGDNRDRDDDHAKVVKAMAAYPADLLLNTGDLVGDAGEDRLWRRFFEIEAPLLGQAPLYAAIGNHELVRDPNAVHFRRYFAMPREAEPAAAPRWYAFDFGNSHFIALDANRPHDVAQHEFLERQLILADRAVRPRHIFVFYHQPAFAAGDECGSAAQQGLWVPEFAQHHVRAVFTGHDHAYERLERNGVRYFVTGGGGAPLHEQSARCADYDRRALRRFEAVHHFLRVRVRGDAATLDAIAASGEIIETVNLSSPSPSEGERPPAVPFVDPPAHSPPGAAAAGTPGAPTTPRWPVPLAVSLLVAAALLLRSGWRRRHE